MTLAERIRELRTMQNMTMREAGIRAGFTPETARSQWWNYESGKTKDPRLSYAVKISRALNVRIDELIQDTNVAD
jgi:transcriptional regulator with XRE-family HTH domain